MGHARLLFTGVWLTSAAAGRVLWPLSPVNLTPRKHGAGRGRGRGHSALSQACLFPSFARHPVWKNTVFRRSVSLGSWGQTSEPRGGCTGGRGRLASDRLLRDAHSVSRFGRCPCPRRLGEGFGAPGLALKCCRPPWEVTPVGAPAAARKVTQAGSGQSQSTPTSRGHTELPRCWVCGCSLWVGLSFPKITVGFPCRYLPPAEATRPAPTARAFRPRRR